MSNLSIQRFDYEHSREHPGRYLGVDIALLTVVLKFFHIFIALVALQRITGGKK